MTLTECIWLVALMAASIACCVTSRRMDRAEEAARRIGAAQIRPGGADPDADRLTRLLRQSRQAEA
jgi:hypothetical protein